MMKDQDLLVLVSGNKPASIDEVITKMKQIDDLLSNDDGLKWFNQMYLMVTREVDLHPPNGGWRDPKWLLTLDVVFAGLYFEAIRLYLSGSLPPLSWKVLFDNRSANHVDHIQFALAGM